MVKEKSGQEQEQVILKFIYQHLSNILTCGNLSHFEASKVFITDKERGGMAIEVDYKYLTFDIKVAKEFVLSLWKANDHTELVKYLCHEVTHIVTTEAMDELKIVDSHEAQQRIFERTTEHTSRWLFRCYVAFMDEHKINIATGLVN